MRKNAFIISSMAVAAFAVLSCAKETDTSTLEKVPKAEGITIGKAEGKLEQLADFVKQELIPLDKALTLAEDPVKLKELLAKQ